MRTGFCDRMGLGAAPVALRLVLGVTFLWAGLGKIQASVPVSSEAMAQRLRDAGISVPTFETWPTDEQAQPSVRRVSTLALKIHEAAFPNGEPREPAGEANDASAGAEAPANVASDAGRTRAIWPARLGTGSIPRILAYAVVVTELAAGILVLVGLFTRLSALSLAGVMLGAVWLTQVGPSIQAGTGLLPNANAYDTSAWSVLLWQCSLIGSSVALAFLGAGALSVDRLLVGRRRRADDGYDDGDDDD